RHDALFHAGMLGQLRAQPRGEPLDLAEVAFDVEAGIGVLRDEQARPGEIDVRLVAADELLELGHTAPRRWKSRTRKPSAARQARYANAPAATSPAIAGSLRCQGAASHHAASPIAKYSTAAITATARPTLPRNTPQPGSGAYTPVRRRIRKSSAAFRHAPRPMASARPAWRSGTMNARFIAWVASRVRMPILTGVRMF